jgi:phenylalanyl-tRNA synthetase alpha subunit
LTSSLTWQKRYSGSPALSSPISNCQSSRQRHAREEKDTKIAQAEARERHMAEEESQLAQTVATQYRDNKTENKEVEKTIRENETTWNKALEKLKADLPPGEAEAQLKGTTLLQLTDTAAQIAVPSTFAVAWLERRLYGQTPFNLGSEQYG